MKILKSFLVTSMGLVLGAVLAGVGGLSAETLYFQLLQTEPPQKIDQYWAETGLSREDAQQIVSNEKCKKSEDYFKACINALVQNLHTVNLKLSAQTGRLSIADKNNQSDELSEKERFQNFKNINLRSSQVKIDFDQALREMFLLETEARKSTLVSNVINAFMAMYYDPHTYIVPSDYFRSVSLKTERSKYFVGISHEKRQGHFFIQKIAKNSDADKAGLKTGDQLLAVNGTKLKNLKAQDLSRILRDERTEIFHFLIERNSQILNMDLVRTYRILSHIQFSVVNGVEAHGILTIAKFSKGACEEVRNILNKKVTAKLSGLILDLRDNPGGQLDEAACVAGLFLGKDRKAYYVEYFDQERPNEVVLTAQEQAYTGPVVTLVNGRTASAAESLAGTLQEYKRSLVVGQRTFGKGTFQEPEEWYLNDKISLFKTQGYYLLPSRNSTQLVGVKPDILLADKNFELREEDYFANPVPANMNAYPPLNAGEHFSLKKHRPCVSQNTKVHHEADIFLQKSIELLDCAEPAKLSLGEHHDREAAARSF